MGRVYSYLVILINLFDSHCATWSQARASWWQLWVELVSALTAVIWLSIHLHSRKIHWHPYFRHSKHGKTEGLSLFLRNSSGLHANDTIILGPPKYVICIPSVDIDLMLFNLPGMINNKFMQIIYKIFDHKGHHNFHRYRFILLHCYVSRIYSPFIKREFSKTSNKGLKEILGAEIKLFRIVDGSDYQIYGNRTNPQDRFIDLKTLSLVFQRQQELCTRFIRKRIHFKKAEYKRRTKIIKNIENSKPSFFNIFNILTFKYLRYLRAYWDAIRLRKSCLIKYNSLLKIRQIYNKKDNNKYLNMFGFTRLDQSILIPCYDLRKHKIQIIHISSRDLL